MRVPSTPGFEALLTEVAQQALLTTRATGAAIALLQGLEMVCRATTGGHAPDLGSRLDTKNGLSGACVQSRRVQICSDTEVDARVDVEACRALGVRSILVAPLLQQEKLVGVMELFSPIVRSFGERDIQTLKACARRILEGLQQASVSRENADLQEQGTLAAPVVEPPHFLSPQSPIDSPASGRRDFATPILTGLVIGLAILFGSLLGMRITRQRGGRLVRAESSALLPKASTTPRASNTVIGSAEASTAATIRNEPREVSTLSHAGAVEPARKSEMADDHAGGLVVYQNDRVVFQIPSPGVKSRSARNIADDASGTTKLSPEDAGQLLTSRVEPQYPPQALAAHIQGVIGLRLIVDRTGAVQRVRVLSGPPELAQAAVDAVRQWRFRPYAPNGTTQDFQTTATIDFRLP